LPRRRLLGPMGRRERRASVAFGAQYARTSKDSTGNRRPAQGLSALTDPVRGDRVCGAAPNDWTATAIGRRGKCRRLWAVRQLSRRLAFAVWGRGVAWRAQAGRLSCLERRSPAQSDKSRAARAKVIQSAGKRAAQSFSAAVQGDLSPWTGWGGAPPGTLRPHGRRHMGVGITGKGVGITREHVGPGARTQAPPARNQPQPTIDPAARALSENVRFTRRNPAHRQTTERFVGYGPSSSRRGSSGPQAARAQAPPRPRVSSALRPRGSRRPPETGCR